jgi:hypothetical protein
MSKRVKILGKKALPIWLLVVVLVACGAGAAAGTVLAGKVTGEVPVAVSQALLNGVPDWKASVDGTLTEALMTQQAYDHKSMIALPNRDFGAVADDNTAFQAAAEMAVGDWAVFHLPLKNASENELIGLLTLSVPECLEVEVFQAAASGKVSEVVRIGLNTWKFTLAYDADYDSNFGDSDSLDSLAILVSVDDTCAPGYYTITGQIKQIAY